MLGLLYHYKAKVVRVIDGDTIVVNIDLGFDFKLGNQSVRLARIDAYETRLGKNTDEKKKSIGLKAKDWLTELIEGKEVIIKTSLIGESKGSFGRIIAEVFYCDPVEFIYDSVNTALVKHGLAVYKKY